MRRDSLGDEFIVRNTDLIGMSFVRHQRDTHQLHACFSQARCGANGIVLKIETRLVFERLPNLIFSRASPASARSEDRSSGE